MVINRLNSGQEGEAEFSALSVPSFHHSLDDRDQDEFEELLELLASQSSYPE